MAEAGGGVKRRCGSNDSSKRCYCLPGAATFFPAVLAFSHVPSRFLAFLPLGLGFLVVISLFFSVFFRFFFSSRFLSSFQSSFRVSLFSGFLSFFFSPPSSQRSWALFIEAKGTVFYSSHGEQPAGRPLGAAAEVRWVVRGGWSAIVFGRWAPGEREGPAKNFKKKAPFFPSSLLHVRGGRRKMNSVVQNDTVLPFSLFFFFFEWMKRRRFG